MDIFFPVKKKATKFILSLFAAVIFQFGYSVIMEAGNFSVYFLSYIHYKQEWVDMQYGNLMRPIIVLFLSLFSPLSGFMENLVGSRLALLISSSTVEVVLIFFYFQRNLWVFYILSLFLGLGCGLSAQIVVKNCCFYYPKKKGFISSCIMSLGALVGSSYTLLGEKIINPEREIVINGQPFYREEIAKRSKYYFIFGMILVPIATSISLFLFYKYDPNCEIENETEEKIENKVDEIKGPLLDGNNEEKKENENINQKDDDDNKTEKKNEKENEIKDKNNDDKKETEKINVSNSFTKSSPKGNVKKVLKNWRFWRIIIISGIMPFGLLFIFSTSRAYSSMLGIDGTIVGTLSGTMNIIGSTCNPIWALCVDKYGFKPVMKIIASFNIFLSVYFFIFMDNKIFYVIGLYISSLSRAGVLHCVNPHVMQIFGLRYYLTLGGFVKLFNQLFNFSIAMISIIISIGRDNYEKLLLPYRIICVCGLALAILGFILVFYENDKKFKFDENEEEKEEKEKEEKEKEEEEKEEKEKEKEKEKEEKEKEKEKKEEKEKDEKEKDKDEKDKEEKDRDKEEKCENEKEEIKDEQKGYENTKDNNNYNNEKEIKGEENNNISSNEEINENKSNKNQEDNN